MIYTLPALWLIIIMVGLPQLSETVYSPALPAIAHALSVTPTLAEYTLTMYLVGFSIGTLFWGKRSDKIGRKPAAIWGIAFFIAGCIGCYFSTTITMLMISRFIQAFGGSIGSVITQSICRDAFKGAELSKVFAVISGSIGFFPAIGPIIGGFIAEHFGWPNIFLFLSVSGIMLILLLIFKLPETHFPQHRKPTRISDIFRRLIADKRVMGLGMIVGLANGIIFSYYGEAPFYFIKLLGLTPSQYGVTYFFLAFSTFMGGVYSRKIAHYYPPKYLIMRGIITISLGALLWICIVTVHHRLNLTTQWMPAIITFMQMIIMFGLCLITSNALSSALTNYKDCIGTASSLLGCYYYLVISLCTFVMGSLHNGSLFTMPIFFLVLGLLTLITLKNTPVDLT